MGAYSKQIHGKLFVSTQFLVDNGFNIGTLNNNFTRFKKGLSDSFNFEKDPINRTKWILYESVPLNNLKRFDLPKTAEKLQKILKNSVPEIQGPARSDTDRDFRECWQQREVWVRYYPEYKDYGFSPKVQTLFAKTHYLIEYIIRLKRSEQFPLKKLYLSYMRMPNVVFKTKSYKYFSAKIRKCEHNKIDEVLVHGFRIHGRKPYKVTPEISKLVRNYLYSPIEHSVAKIHRLVNHELVGKKLQKVSESTVRRICSDVELVNRSMLMRSGTTHAENHLLPFLDRDNVKNVGDLYVIDSTRLNFPYRLDGEVKYLWLCSMIDVNSRKIVGYSFGDRESLDLANNCLRFAFLNNHIIPLHLLCDNHGCFRSYEFKALRTKLMDYGISVRKARSENPKDKGHIESWFGVLQKKYLFGRMGFLGEGIKTKNKGGRVSREMKKLIFSKEWEVSRDELVAYVEEDIQTYNDDFHETLKGVPSVIYRSAQKDISRIFDRADISMLFGTLKEIKVRNGKIRFKHLKRKYTYQIWNNKLINKLNGTKVKVRFHEPDMGEVEIFDLNDDHQCNLSLETRVSPVPYTDDEVKVYQNFHLKKLGIIQDNLESIYEDLVPEGEEAIALPNLSLDDKATLKLKAVKELDRKLMEKTFKRYKIGKFNSSSLQGDSENFGDFIFYRSSKRKKNSIKLMSDETASTKKEI